MFQKLRFRIEETSVISNDNQQTIRLLNSKIPKLETRFRHVDISQCWLLQEMQLGHITVDYISTARMVADGLIKVFSFQKHLTFIQMLGMKNLNQKIMRLKGITK